MVVFGMLTAEIEQMQRGCFAIESLLVPDHHSVGTKRLTAKGHFNENQMF
jgi:hypothetical protein